MSSIVRFFSIRISSFTGFDPEAAAKQRVSKGFLDSKVWFLSWQVVQEFSSVALHRFAVPMKANDLADYISLKLWP